MRKFVPINSEKIRLLFLEYVEDHYPIFQEFKGSERFEDVGDNILELGKILKILGQTLHYISTKRLESTDFHINLEEFLCDKIWTLSPVTRELLWKKIVEVGFTGND